MQKYSKFVTLIPLLNDISNQTSGQYDNQDIAVHSSNKGMTAIEDIIWEGPKGF